MIEKRLEQLVPNRPEPLFQAVRYSLLVPGKRFRPRLVLAAASSRYSEEALDPACAIEMIHTYSLIHDDLPCMDDDDLRRGRPTLHKVYGEAIALLAGDFLLTHAFEVLAKAPLLDADQRIELIGTLARHAGGAGMIGGQAIDISSKGQTIEEADLEQMHIGKTGALITACLEFGSIIAKTPEKRPLMRQIGREAGLAYQILDDILDHTGTLTELGKNAGTDAARGKPNAVSLYGLIGAKEKLERLKSSLTEKTGGFPTELKELLQKLLQRSGV